MIPIHLSYTNTLNPTFVFLIIPPPPRSTLFPYTTLFRSRGTRRTRLTRARQEADMAQPRAADLLAVAIHQLPGEERSEEHTSELQSHSDLVCRLLLEKKKKSNM